MHRGEFVNMYSLVSSAEQAETDPRRWELYGSDNNRDYVLIDSRSDEQFSYRLQKRSFYLNNAPRNYRYFLFRIRAHRIRV